MICEEVPIWADHPEYQPKEYQPGCGVPVLRTYVIDGKEKRPSVLVLPGSGYIGLCDAEAEAVALKFISNGYNAFVLYYSVRPNYYPQPFYDGFQAISMIRDNADKWLVNTTEIAVVGFSAGGHLAAGLGALWNDEAFFSDIPVLNRESCIPNALVLGYPMISSGEFRPKDCIENLLGSEDSPLIDAISFEKHIGPDMPPVFIWHPLGDIRVPPENSMLLAKALREHAIPFELHLYMGGFHGMSVCDDPAYTEDEKRMKSWLTLALEWLTVVFDLPKTGE